MDSPKFINHYQGRIYFDVSQADYNEPIEPKYFKEYISVGFETYFSNPELLKSKDMKLFEYLEAKLK